MLRRDFLKIFGGLVTVPFGIAIVGKQPSVLMPMQLSEPVLSYAQQHLANLGVPYPMTPEEFDKLPGYASKFPPLNPLAQQVKEALKRVELCNSPMVVKTVREIHRMMEELTGVPDVRVEFLDPEIIDVKEDGPNRLVFTIKATPCVEWIDLHLTV